MHKKAHGLILKCPQSGPRASSIQRWTLEGERLTRALHRWSLLMDLKGKTIMK